MEDYQNWVWMRMDVVLAFCVMKPGLQAVLFLDLQVYTLTVLHIYAEGRAGADGFRAFQVLPSRVPLEVGGLVRFLQD